jgi:hypothetical protein
MVRVAVGQVAFLRQFQALQELRIFLRWHILLVPIMLPSWAAENSADVKGDERNQKKANYL